MMLRHAFFCRRTSLAVHPGLSSLMVAGLTCSILGGSLSHADTVAYWQFEDSPGYLKDSSGNNPDLTIVGVDSSVQGTIPLSGPGSEFDTLAGNTKMATSPAANGYFSVPDAPHFSFTDFSVEAFINIDDTPACCSGTRPPADYIATQYELGSATDKSWAISVSIHGVSSGLQIEDGVWGNLYMIASDGTNTPIVNSGLRLSLIKTTI